jgi:DNA modification methylase
MKIQKVPIERVEPWADNPRGIKTKDYERLKRQILELGIYKPLVCYRENGKFVVLGGNMRIRALKDIGMKEVEVSVVEAKTKAQKIKYALSDNDRVGFYEEDKLAELVYPHLEEIKLEDFKVDLGEAIDLKQVVERYGPDIDDGADDVPEIDDTPAVTKMGDLFTLGKHRLLCGDSTKAEDVARLMRGEKADMVFTDPPYGANISGMMQETHGDQSAINRTRRWEQIKGDDKEDQELQTFLEKAFRCFADHSKDNAAWYIWHAMLTQGFFSAAAAAADLLLHRQIIWVKPCLILAFGHYHWRHELCFYGWKRGHEPKFYGEKNSNTVWEMDYDGKGRMAKDERVHVTQKPVNLAIKAIRNSSADGELIIDGFLGSGTTLIAAEKTGRVCYGLEIDPKYCDVIIKRYADYVGADEKSIRKTVEHGK